MELVAQHENPDDKYQTFETCHKERSRIQDIVVQELVMKKAIC
jgi:hypothetical protein